MSGPAAAAPPARRGGSAAGADPEPRSGVEAVEAVRSAGKSGKIEARTVANALAFFLEEGGDQRPAETDEFTLNFGGPVDDDGNGLDKDNPPVWVPWEIGGLDDGALDQARKQSTKGNRSQKRRGDGEVDETEVARRIVFAGTLSPDISAYGKQKGMVDPADAVRSMFQRKPGLVVQISGRILNFSGYDENDLRERDEREVEAGKP